MCGVFVVSRGGSVASRGGSLAGLLSLVGLSVLIVRGWVRGRVEGSAVLGREGDLCCEEKVEWKGVVALLANRDV